LGIPFGSLSFAFPFLQKALDEDIYHIVPKVKGCPCGLWNPLSKSCPKAILFSSFPPPILEVLTPIGLFLLNPHVGFWEVSKFMFFFECLEVPLVCEHVFPMSKRGINLISIKVITLMAYMVD
jgi:hypothetical protein